MGCEYKPIRRGDYATVSEFTAALKRDIQENSHAPAAEYKPTRFEDVRVADEYMIGNTRVRICDDLCRAENQRDLNQKHKINAGRIAMASWRAEEERQNQRP